MTTTAPSEPQAPKQQLQNQTASSEAARAATLAVYRQTSTWSKRSRRALLRVCTLLRGRAR